MQISEWETVPALCYNKKNQVHGLWGFLLSASERRTGADQSHDHQMVRELFDNRAERVVGSLWRTVRIVALDIHIAQEVKRPGWINGQVRKPSGTLLLATSGQRMTENQIIAVWASITTRSLTPILWSVTRYEGEAATEHLSHFRYQFLVHWLGRQWPLHQKLA